MTFIEKKRKPGKKENGLARKNKTEYADGLALPWTWKQ
jgi:hypothetical protein